MTDHDSPLRPSRRTLIGGAAALGMAGAARAATAAGEAPALLVSTWDFGVAANKAAFARLSAGGSILDAVEAGARVPEADPDVHTVGLGGYPDRDGRVTLDAVIMDDKGRVGAVAALEDVVHAVSVARAVMEKTPHTLLVGDGATQFALANGFEKARLLTTDAEKAWRDWLKTSRYQPVANIENRRPLGDARDHDTIGILGRDRAGNLAGACTTSGMAFKMHGRVGDSPQVGCGLYVEAGIGAATSSGLGEEVTRTAGSARVVASMRAGVAPTAACREAVMHIARLRGDAVRNVQVGFLAIDRHGQPGAFALMRGFTYAVTDSRGNTAMYAAESLRD